MQLQGLMLILFLIVIPMIALFANHNIFFIVMSFILFVNSANSILSMFLRTNEEHVNTSESLSDELIEELEEVLNIDIRRFD